MAPPPTSYALATEHRNRDVKYKMGDTVVGIAIEEEDLKPLPTTQLVKT